MTEAIRLSGLTRYTIYKHTVKNSIVPHKIGKRNYYEREPLVSVLTAALAAHSASASKDKEPMLIAS